MDVCKVEHCGKIANLDNLCLFHRKKDVAGQLAVVDGKTYDTCAQGHLWTPENTRWEPNQKGGKRRRCKQCIADKQERKRNEEPVIEAPAPIRLADPVMRGAHELLDRTANHLQPKCKGQPEKYTDYTGESIPTDVEAAKLCAGCPLLAPCGNAAAARREGWGVWGGQVWVYGEPYDGDQSKLDADD